ncbi:MULTISPECIES: 3-hydroxyisobutyrate dehydrogenase [unclassified Rhizobium]|uniref:3-hydroxyisobutyrate dehydrogenase n=1 Tax=unclassified Rhizobium TaxID=2613769 RepID=UPI000712F52C|nr:MULTISPECIES: 3-hydroxyisobutyrate dehydrogenase [unclassified Rhizobium]KQS90876.1 3-hydroxyisobutyrate dehydrogenase [Rhizobium sp. Leaf391]KQS95964.1 3-hydroxyisobutyrate dehydrogenase [Rhizobium sp. Leaf386]KQU09961.1 3-hydroxyisobutyrate dehydrogenase [Rhizobium sp. Leaf453]
MTSIGFIGLGHMGGPMAANLVKAGHAVKGFDLAQPLLDQASKNGVTACTSLAEAVEDVDTVITMLPAGKHVLSVWQELVAAVPSSTLLIDCSTIDIDSARKAHELAAGKGCPSLDAPVSGGTGGAAAGTLTFMIGGEQQAFADAAPIFQAMGKKIIHCGGASAGQAAKICNNMILGISMIAVGEAFVLGEKLGLSHQALFDVASVSSGQCWSLTTYCPVPGPVPASPANNDYKPGFAGALMLKDLKLSQEAAAASGATTPLGAKAAELYQMFNDIGHADTDFSGIINLLREKSADL